MLRKIAMLIFTAVGAISLSAQVQSPYPPAPGHENLPVVFWSHYMPQVGTGQIDQNGHAHGGTDSFPFVTCATDSEEQHIIYALDAGINGFQMLTWPAPSMYEAARKVFAKTGKMFYVSPQWSDQGDNFDKAVEQMAKFAVEHKDDPHVFRIDGKQVHFFYGGLKWAGKNNELLPKAKEIIKSKGVEVLFIPEYSPTDKLLLDRTELKYANWPFLKKPEPGPFKWLAETTCDGIDSWGPGDTPYTTAEMIIERIKKGPNKSFIYMPEIWPGYDSSNRAWQAIHCQNYGLKVLRDNLRQWIEMGIRQFDFVTWNDVNETMLLPSTRSPFGFSEIIRYYHQLAVDGTSPFESPKVVVSYDSEVMYGDELYFQFLCIPEKDAITSDYICQVRLEDINGAEAANLTTRTTVPSQKMDTLAEARLDTTQFLGRAEIFSPVVDVYRVDRNSNERKKIFENLRLAPVILRYNKVQFFTPYAIALDRVAPDVSISLDALNSTSVLSANTGDIIPFKAVVKGSESLRRLSLAESRLNRGAFRADDTAAAIGDGKVNFFLRIRCDNDFTYKLSLSKGKIIERYANHWDIPRVLKKVDASSYESKAFPHGKSPGQAMQHSPGKPVFRIVVAPDSTITLVPTGSDKPVVETTLSRLASGPLTEAVNIDGVRTTIRLELALDASEFNIDYPLPKDGQFVRFVNVDSLNDATRYFHAWALTASDRISYSRPIEIIRVPLDNSKGTNFLFKSSAQKTVVQSPDDEVSCQFIHTRGIFDDFVDSASSSSRNPFSAKDIVDTGIPARLTPYYLYDFEEGAGSQLNDGGTAHQVGRAWLSGNYEWIKDGWRGGAIRLKGGSIDLRAKSFPHGAYTFSARIRISPAGVSAPIAGDGDHWQGVTMEGLRIDILSDGRVKASRKIRECEGEAISKDALKTGWNHIAVTHDLRTLKIFINGTLSGEGPVSRPGYQRTHSTPTIAMSKVEKSLEGNDAKASVLTGDLDQIELIGTAIDGASVSKLNDLGQWMAR